MSASKGIQGAQQGLSMASDAAGMAGPWGAVASMGMDLIGGLLGIKGPKQKRQEAEQARQAAKQKQLSTINQQTAQNPGVVAGGGTLPLPSPPVAQSSPVQLPAPPQVQLQQPAFGGQQQSPLGGQRNNYMMKMLMQGNR